MAATAMGLAERTGEASFNRFLVLQPVEASPGHAAFLVSDLQAGGKRRILTLSAGPGDFLEDWIARRQAAEHHLLPPIRGIGRRGRRLGLVTDAPDSGPLDPWDSGWTFQERLALTQNLIDLVEFLHARGLIAGIIGPWHLRGRDHALEEFALVWPTPQPDPLDQRERVALHYAAPECLDDESSSRSDLYSLGMLFYEIFTGVRPFREVVPERLGEMHGAVELRRPRSLVPDLPDPVEQVIVGLSRKEPDRRMSLRTASALLSSETLALAKPAGPSFTTHLVGREAELAQLRRLLHDFARLPSPRMVLATGPMGSGKTALLDRFAATCTARGLAVLPVLHRPGEEGLTAFTSPSSSWWTQMDPDVGRTATGNWLQTTLEKISEKVHPIILAEKLHEASAEALLAYASLLQSDLPVMLVAECRSGTQRRGCRSLQELASRLNRFDRIEVGSLAPTATAELIGLALAPNAPPGLRERLRRRCGGNPGYVMAVLAELRQRRQLTYSRGSWTWREPSSLNPGLLLPAAALHSVIAEINSLNPFLRSLLDYLVLLRGGLDLKLLARTSGLPIDEVEQQLQTLVKRGMVECAGTIQVPVYQVTVPWLIDAVEHSLSPEDRQRCARRILAHLVASTRDSLEVMQLALDSGDADLLKQYLFEATDQLASQRRHRQALQLLTEALERGSITLRDWPVLRRLVHASLHTGQFEFCRHTVEDALQSIMNSDQKAYLLLSLARIHLARDANVEAALALRKAFPLAPGGSVLKTRILAELLSALSRIGIGTSTRRVAHQVLALLRSKARVARRDRLFHAVYRYATAAQSELSASAVIWESRSVRTALRDGETPTQRLCLLARHYLRMGQWKHGLALTDHIRKLAEGTENPRLEVSILTLQALAARKRGRHQEAEQHLEEALGAGRQLRWGPELELELCLELARNSCHQLAIDSTVRYLDRIEDLRAGSSQDAEGADLPLLRGWWSLLAGDPEGTVEAIGRLLSSGHHRDPRVYLLEGSLWVHQGDLLAARRAAAKGIRWADPLPWYLGRARLLQAEIALHEGQIAKALALVRPVLRDAQSGWSEPLHCRSHLLRAQCLRRQGRTAEARAHALRAWQIARWIERPGLRSEIGRVLAELAVKQGDLAAACDWLLRVLDPLEEQAARISGGLRDRFRERHIAPLEQMLLGIGQDRPRLAAVSLSLSRFSAGLRISAQDPGLLRSLAECLAGQFQNASFALFLRGSDHSAMRLELSRGRMACAPRPEELAQNTSGSLQIRRWRGLTIVLLPLRTPARTEGFLHLELPGCLTESEADLIQAARNISDLYLTRNAKAPARVSGTKPPASDRLFVGNHPLVQALMAESARFARSDGTVLITGETGTGKEVIAQFLHSQSPRRNGPFVPVNCAALPADLVESELFGHSEGSFTGASRPRPGLFESAAGGTLFLDEISSMPLALQPRLLRVLQERKTRRLGENRERPVDVRVIAATNQNLRGLVDAGGFRLDLFHRLNVLSLTLPPLRERLSDIPQLAHHFLARLERRTGTEIEIAEGALRALAEYHYPGNVRELENLLESLALCAPDATITQQAVRQRLRDSRIQASPPGCGRVEAIYASLSRAESDFWRLVRDPFLNRDLCRDDVTELLSRFLAENGGSYRRLLQAVGLPDTDYKRLMNFLESHGCKVDFRPFRDRGHAHGHRLDRTG